jgi:hypothetical protein
MFTTGILFEQELRKALEDEIEQRKEELSWGGAGVDYQRATGVIQGLRAAQDICDEVAKKVMLTR